MLRVYDELVEFLATGSSPRTLIDYVPSDAVRSHVAELLRAEKSVGLAATESSELAHYLQLEHLLRLAKARARKHLLDE